MTILRMSSRCTEALGFSKIRLHRGGSRLRELPALPHIREHLVQHKEGRTRSDDDEKHSRHEDYRTIATRPLAMRTVRRELAIEHSHQLFWRCLRRLGFFQITHLIVHVWRY
jgi:hypothetical protein